MSESYVLPSKEIPVYGEFDVVVAGGGPAGCAAAVSAARLGMNTLLIEKEGYLGGAAVAQNVLVILSTNGVDFQGIWHEFMTEMKKRRGVYEEDFQKSPAHFFGTVDPEIVKYSWDALISDSGAKILHHAQIIDVMKDGNVITGAVVMTKAGAMAIRAKRLIDCTGDGMAAHFAGVSWDQGANGNPYAMALTKAFRLGNVPEDAGARDMDELAKLQEICMEEAKNGRYSHPLMFSGRGSAYIGVKRIIWRMPKHMHEILLVTSRILKCDPLNPDEITRAEREGREQVWEVADFFKRYVPGCEESYLTNSGNHVGVRSSRRVKGLATVTDKDALSFAKYPDSIARSSWDIDVWPADSYMNPAVDRGSPEHNQRLERLQAGDYFDIRYGCIVARGVENLLLGGRIISAEHLAESSLRIQQTCMSIGEAAGTAAALSIRENVAPSALEPMTVVRHLENSRAKVVPAFRILENLF